MIIIDSIQIGKVFTEGDPEARDADTRLWTSAFRKSMVANSVTVTVSGIIGDEVADTKNHGGPDKAVLCYAAVHYLKWKSEHPDLDFAAGGFGENLTLGGVTESDVCIGDRYRSAECLFEISQPRQPCWKIARRWQTKTLTKEVAQTGRTGWYLRVICGGELMAGSTLELDSRPNPQWTIARANDVLYGREKNRIAVQELANLPELSREWKTAIVGQQASDANPIEKPE
ncbi:MAG: MOSC domain-containing protein [Planctomycetales bacterium]|nr:MOSC domain-containing protein [Planctomycetales bacterium]